MSLSRDRSWETTIGRPATRLSDDPRWSARQVADGQDRHFWRGCHSYPLRVENAERWWIRPLDRTVPLAKIRIPRQEFEAPNQLYDRGHMMFSPWNCLPQHRPLGSINRMRLAVYLASLQVRRKLNMVVA